MHFVTFPVGALIPSIGRRIGDVPVLLLANPEEPGANKMWEQNSFCGANLGGFVMNRLKKQYAYLKALPADTADALQKYLRVVRCIKGLQDLRIGLVGGRVPGFYTSNFDEMKLRRELGVTVEVSDLAEMIHTAGKLNADQMKAAERVVRDSAHSVCGVTEAGLEKAARMFGSLKAMADKYRLNQFAVRCWPECSDLFGIAPCAVLGMLSDNGYPTSCEGDIPGAVTMGILRMLAGGGIPFFVDLISYDEKDNTGVVWHCGAAPKSLCRKFEETQLRLHMRVDGGDKKGVTNDFSLKAGRITLAKLDQSVEGEYRMLIAPGTAVDTEPYLRGNPLRIRFDDPVPALIDTIMKEGFEHHYAVIHADVRQELLQFCEWMKIKPVTIG
jgi:L-fucose isomerase and related proteins